jgi:hypothetical protein
VARWLHSQGTAVWRGALDIRNRWVHFRICDVYIPDPEKLLMSLYGKNLLQGKVVDLSDSAAHRGLVAVVQVEELAEPVIVPLERILGVL